jgi:hypothetical protein
VLLDCWTMLVIFIIYLSSPRMSMRFQTAEYLYYSNLVANGLFVFWKCEIFGFVGLPLEIPCCSSFVHFYSYGHLGTPIVCLHWILLPSIASYIHCRPLDQSLEGDHRGMLFRKWALASRLTVELKLKLSPY